MVYKSTKYLQMPTPTLESILARRAFKAEQVASPAKKSTGLNINMGQLPGNKFRI